MKEEEDEDKEEWGTEMRVRSRKVLGGDKRDAGQG